MFNDFTAIADRDFDLFGNIATLLIPNISATSSSSVSYNVFFLILCFLDVIGNLRLVSGGNLKSATTTETAIEVAENRSKDRVFHHLLMQE